MTIRLFLAALLFVGCVVLVLFLMTRTVYRFWMFESPGRRGRAGKPVTASLYEQGVRQGDSSLPSGAPGRMPYWDCTYVYYVEGKKGRKERFYDCDFLGTPPEEITLYLTPFGTVGPVDRSATRRDGFVRAARPRAVGYLPMSAACVAILAAALAALALVAGLV